METREVDPDNLRMLAAEMVRQAISDLRSPSSRARFHAASFLRTQMCREIFESVDVDADDALSRIEARLGISIAEEAKA